MPSNEANDVLAFYCPAHQVRFHAAGERIIGCEQGGHALGYGFPNESWWVYCCDCGTFWPSETRNIGRSDCMVCERPTAHRYLCQACQVVSIESSALVRRKIYSIDDAKGIQPNCPGCSAHAQGRVLEHECTEFATTFFTPRSVCPFCEEKIRSDDPGPTTIARCPHCGTLGKAEETFCGRCGKSKPGRTQTARQLTQAGASRVELGSAQRMARRNLDTSSPRSISSITDSQPVIFADKETVSEDEIDDEISGTSDIEEEAAPSLPADQTSADSMSGVLGSTTRIDAGSTYTPQWETALQQQPPKRRVVWIPAAVAVAVTVGIVMTIALVLSGKRSGSKPTGSEQAASPVPPQGMAYVRGGEFTMGSDAGDEYERPAHKVTVKSFFIDIYEVPCEEYEKFVKATGHKAPPNWVNGGCPPGQGRKPVVGVDWYDANAYAAWAKKRLPTEEEWEFAARGTDGRKYPWGNEWRANAANAGDTSAGQVVDVGNYPDGKSPFGAMDMVGNAWEWTASDLHAYSGGRIPDQVSGELKVIRGGFWRSSTPKATTTFRRGWDARDAREGYGNTGFRCARDL